MSGKPQGRDVVAYLKHSLAVQRTFSNATLDRDRDAVRRWSVDWEHGFRAAIAAAERWMLRERSGYVSIRVPQTLEEATATCVMLFGGVPIKEVEKILVQQLEAASHSSGQPVSPAPAGRE